MATQLTAEDARQSLTSHVEQKGVEVFVKYGAVADVATLDRLLADRVYVRYPCELVFDVTPLQPGEFAHPEQKGSSPEEGFTMFVHPEFESQPENVARAVLYQLVAVNYGEFASSAEAETFGAAALGITRDEYYDLLCGLSAQVGGSPDDEREVMAEPDQGCGGGGCHCGHS
ncbi:MAG: hypothetical protein RIQ93_541 [Verrucomicrobiota bacterium]|jgi:hypothetical protein